MSQAIAITGIGPISPIGIGREDFCAGVSEGREGRLAPEEGAAGFGSLPLVARCLDFFVEDYLQSEKTYLDRCSEFVLASCALALEDAGLQWEDLDHPRFGLALGTAFGCLDSLANVTARVQEKGVRFASPMIFTHAFANSPASLAAIEYRIQGPCSALCTGATSSATALRYAMDVLADGRAKVMLAGGADALSLPLIHALAAGMPWSGETPGEGACLFALEPTPDAEARGANILGELLAVELRGDADTAVSAALGSAGLTEADVAPARVALMGECMGADTALQAAAALCGPDEDDQFIIRSAAPAGRQAAAVIRRWR